MSDKTKPERTCAICPRPVPPDSEVPLCEFHDGASREAGRQEAERERHEREVGR